MKKNEKGLTESQQAYYDNRVQHFSGFGIAIPFGFIRKEAKKKSDAECIAFIKATEVYHV